jgi:hypothetical protein
MSQIQVTFNSLGRRGKFHKIVQIQTNDPLNPLVELSVSGFIEQGLVTIPPMLDFGILHQGQTAQREIIIRYPAFTPQGIRSIEPLPELDIVYGSELTTSPPGTRIKAKLKSNLPVGTFNGTLILHLKNAQLSPFRIPVRANVLEPIEVRPSSLSIVVKDGIPPAEKILKIINHGNKSFQIEKLDYDRNLFEIDLKPIFLSRGYSVTIRLKKTSEIKNVASQLVLFTSNPENPKIRIPVQVWILRKALSDKP